MKIAQGCHYRPMLCENSRFFDRMGDCGQESGGLVNHRGPFYQRVVVVRCSGLHPLLPRSAGLSALATCRQVADPTRSDI